MSDWPFLNKYRIREGKYGSSEELGWCGCFVFPWRGAVYIAMSSDQLGWKHVSITRQNAARCPSWELMCEIKELFFEPEDCVVQYHPPQSRYVNNHPYCLHLWMPLEQALPVPPDIFVGTKDMPIVELDMLNDLLTLR